MKEINTILAAYHATDHQVEKLALATVVRVEGSSYRRIGARMLVSETGRFFGGISGGCLEGDALRRAQKAIVFNTPSLVTYDTTQDDGHQIGVGLGCNGIIDVLFTPLDPANAANAVTILNSVVGTRYPTCLVTITGHRDINLLGKTFLYQSAEHFSDSFPCAEILISLVPDIQRGLDEETTRSHVYSVNGSELRVLAEVLLPVQRLLVFGSNYDVYPLLRISKELGWDSIVVANIHKARKELFDVANSVIHSGSPDKLDIDRYTACLMMAHDLETDVRNFRTALRSSASYIGLLGPRKRAEKIFSRLEEMNEPVGEEDMQRVFAPAGLDIGAVTPEEIGISIVAEVRAQSAGRSGHSLRERQGSIHSNNQV